MAGKAGMSVNDRYVLLELIGQGGMGRVWRSRDRVLDREVAVKEVLLPPDLLPSERAQFLVRMREAQAAAGLDHPGVIAIYDVTEFDGIPWVVMRLVNGPSLGDVVKRDGRLPWQRVAEIGEQVADALASVHAVGAVHRDLKPNDILLTEQRAIVTDFGIAEVAATLSDPGTIIGTPHYLAPEQFDQRPVGPAADMWALGAILYEAAEGRPPFAGATLSAVTDEVLAKSPDVPANAGPLSGLIQSLLSKEASERPDAATTARVLAGFRSPPAKQPTAASLDVMAGILSSPAVTVSPHPQPSPVHSPPAAPAPAGRPGMSTPAAPSRTLAFTAAAIGVAAVVATGVAILAHPGRSGPAPSSDGRPSSQAAAPSGVPSSFTTTGSAASPQVNGSLLMKLSNPGRVDSVAFAPDGVTLAAGDHNGSTYLWNVFTDSRTATFQAPGNGGNNSVCVAFAPDGKTVASTDSNGSTYLWDAATGTRIATLTEPGSQGVDTAAFISDGKTVATSDNSGNVYLWNAGTHAWTGLMNGVGGKNVFTADGAMIAFTTPAGVAVPTGAAVQLTDGLGSKDFTEPGGKAVQAIALTPDGAILATGDRSGSTYLWSTLTGAEIATIADPGKQSIWSLAFTADDKVLATGDFKGHVDLWDTSTGRKMATLTGPASLITSLAFSPDDQMLAASDYNGNVYLFGIAGA